MNFDEGGDQRPISSPDSLDDERIGSGPSQYPIARRKSTGTAGSVECELPSDLNEADVLCGRTKHSFNHPGNKRFRDLITSAIPNYNKAESRLEKSLVVHSIVENIRALGGRFLKVQTSTGQWQELDDRASRDKVGHAIRDAATTPEVRRKKKKIQKQKASTRGGRRTSHHAEMKLEDHAEPVSFHEAFQSGFPGAGIGQMGRGLPSNALDGHSFPPLHASRAPASRRRSGQQGNGDSPGSDDSGFLRQIDEVLGPMPPDHDNDPLADLLGLS